MDESKDKAPKKEVKKIKEDKCLMITCNSKVCFC